MWEYGRLENTVIWIGLALIVLWEFSKTRGKPSLLHPEQSAMSKLSLICDVSLAKLPEPTKVEILKVTYTVL